MDVENLFSVLHTAVSSHGRERGLSLDDTSGSFVRSLLRLWVAQRHSLDLREFRALFVSADAMEQLLFNLHRHAPAQPSIAAIHVDVLEKWLRLGSRTRTVLKSLVGPALLTTINPGSSQGRWRTTRSLAAHLEYPKAEINWSPCSRWPGGGWRGRMVVSSDPKIDAPTAAVVELGCTKRDGATVIYAPTPSRWDWTIEAFPGVGVDREALQWATLWAVARFEHSLEGVSAVAATSVAE